jgi:energy-coupling factor transport system permease protein
LSRGASLFFYRRMASPLHAARAGVGALWVLSLSVAALLLYHPLALVVLLAAVLGAAWATGVGNEMRRALLTASIIGVPIVLVNVLASRQGLTVFARLGDLGPFGEGDLTVEAVVYGAVVALKVTIVILLGTLASLAIDPDELLRLVRRLSFRSALTASLAVRMVPLLAADAQRLGEAQRTRPGGAGGGPRARVALLAAVLGGSLDRAMDVAATLEVRGFANARRARRFPRSWSRHDIAFAASAVAVLAVAVPASRAGWFSAYPTVQLTMGAAPPIAFLALAAAALAPFADRRGIAR